MVDLLADRWHRLFGALAGGVVFVVVAAGIVPHVHLRAGAPNQARGWFVMCLMGFSFSLGAVLGAAIARHCRRTIPTLLPHARVVRGRQASARSGSP